MSFDLVNSPAVLNQVEDNLVQHLLKQRSADPQVLRSLRGEAWQSRQLPQAVLTLQALGSPAAEGESQRICGRKVFLILKKI